MLYSDFRTKRGYDTFSDFQGPHSRSDARTSVLESRVSGLEAPVGRTIGGNAVVYGDVARVGYGRERIAPGAFGDVNSLDVILNFQHRRDRPLARTGGGGLVVSDSPTALTVRATLPETREADDALALVKSGVLRGLSIEFRAVRERLDAGVRVIEVAELSGVGLVDRPAYPASIADVRELREDGAGLAGRFVYGTDAVIADRGSTRKRRVMPGAFRYAIEDQEREISLLAGMSYDHPLASRKAGTLRLTDSAAALEFSVEELPDTGYSHDLRAQIASGAAVLGVMPLFRIPPPDVVPDATEVIPEVGNPGVGIELVREAVLTALAIVARPVFPDTSVERRGWRIWL